MKILTRDHSGLDQGKNRGSANLPDCGYILKAEATKFSDIGYEGRSESEVDSCFTAQATRKTDRSLPDVGNLWKKQVWRKYT